MIDNFGQILEDIKSKAKTNSKDFEKLSSTLLDKKGNLQVDNLVSGLDDKTQKAFKTVLNKKPSDLIGKDASTLVNEIKCLLD